MKESRLQRAERCLGPSWTEHRVTHEWRGDAERE